MTIEELKKLGSVEGKTKKAIVDGLYAHFSASVWKRCVKSCKQGSVVDLAPMIAESLKTRLPIWDGANKVIFEQQPDKRMMAVQAMMHMWFECHDFSTKGISAVHKLSNMVSIEDSTKTYKGRKKTGIIHASALVPEGWKSYMLKHPKKDDLADAFLQGLWFLESVKKD
jgi:hypothetical protein